MRILITGITGYIGSHLARALLPEHQVYGLVREPLNDSYIRDIRVRLRLLFYDGSWESMERAVQESQPDLTYHLATYYTGEHGAEQTPKLIESNIELGAYLLEALSSLENATLVYASTVMVHYQGEAYRPLNLYAATKKAFSDLLAYYTDVGSIRAVTLVLSDTYGPDDQRPKVLNLVRSAVYKGENVPLTSGEQDYDAVYIDDVVHAFRIAGEQLIKLKQWSNEFFQVYSLNPPTLRKIVEELLKISSLDFQPGWGDRPHPTREIFKAVRVFPRLPGWEPKISVEEGLHRMWHHNKTDTEYNLLL